MLFAHLDRMALVMETDRSHRNRIARRTTRPGLEFGEPIIGVIHTSSPVGPCDEDSLPPMGFVVPLRQFVRVYQPGPSGRQATNDKRKAAENITSFSVSFLFINSSVK